MKLLQKIPLPIAGLMLALATLGNLLSAYHLAFKHISGGLSFAIWLLVTLKIILIPSSLKEGLENPIVASVLCTYPMGMMVLSTYMKPLASTFALIFWSIAIFLHLVLLGYFTLRFIRRLALAKVFPSYFIVFVGFVVASVTAPAFQAQQLGRILFWFGLVNFIWLFPIVVRRIFTMGIDLLPAKPTMTIMAAPASLLLAGYLSSFQVKNELLVYALLLVAMTLYLYVFFQLPRMLKSSFYPSFSAFTFPMVISGVAFKKASVFFSSQLPWLGTLADISIIVAGLITYYVLFTYLGHLVPKKVLRSEEM